MAWQFGETIRGVRPRGLHPIFLILRLNPPPLSPAGALLLDFVLTTSLAIGPARTYYDSIIGPTGRAIVLLQTVSCADTSHPLKVLAEAATDFSSAAPISGGFTKLGEPTSMPAPHFG